MNNLSIYLIAKLSRGLSTNHKDSTQTWDTNKQFRNKQVA